VTDSLTQAKLDRLQHLRELKVEQKRAETGDDAKRPWLEIARPEQLEPEGDWFVWLILAGRGWGKTRSAAEAMSRRARRFPGCRIALVARTVGDTRDTMFEGESGLLTCLRAEELRDGSVESAYNRSLGELYMANGSRFKAFTSEKPWRLRGPQFHAAWADEACFWADAHKGTVTDTTWSNLTIATRLPPRYNWPSDYRTQIVVATTPRPVSLLRVTDTKLMAPGLMQRENVIITRGRTTDNLDNLSDSYKANVIAPLIGTQLGRQELDAEILESRENALWQRTWLDDDRLPADANLELARVVVGVDPAVTDGETADLTGIIVAGADRAGHGYVLGDYTMRGTPMECMRKVVWAYHHHEADRIVAEVNNGGDYIGTVVKTIDPGIPFRSVRASRGKETRAEPVSSLYQQHRAHHVGTFPQLEDEMCTWAPGDPESPDRVDALVWAFYDLADLVSGSWMDAYGVAKCEACTRPFLSTVNGVKRDRCPHCGVSLPVAEAVA
jgi:phage terminase large subunit-like protein